MMAQKVYIVHLFVLLLCCARKRDCLDFAAGSFVHITLKSEEPFDAQKTFKLTMRKNLARPNLQEWWSSEFWKQIFNYFC